MKAKAMCIKRICMAFFDAAEDSAAISCYAKSFSGQWAEMTVLQMRGGTDLPKTANPARGFLFIGKTSEYVVIKTT